MGHQAHHHGGRRHWKKPAALLAKLGKSREDHIGAGVLGHQENVQEGNIPPSFGEYQEDEGEILEETSTYTLRDLPSQKAEHLQPRQAPPQSKAVVVRTVVHIVLPNGSTVGRFTVPKLPATVSNPQLGMVTIPAEPNAPVVVTPRPDPGSSRTAQPPASRTPQSPNASSPLPSQPSQPSQPPQPSQPSQVDQVTRPSQIVLVPSNSTPATSPISASSPAIPSSLSETSSPVTPSSSIQTSSPATPSTSDTTSSSDSSSSPSSTSSSLSTSSTPSTTSSTASSASTSTSWASSQTSSGFWGGGGGGAPTSDGTPVPTAGSGHVDSDSSTLSPPKIVGSVVGSVAGFVILLLVALFIFRHRKKKGGAAGALPSQPAGTAAAATGAAAMSETNTSPRSSDGPLTASLFAPARAFNRWRNSGQSFKSEEIAPGQRGFQKLGGRKIKSVLETGGDGYDDGFGSSHEKSYEHGSSALAKEIGGGIVAGGAIASRHGKDDGEKRSKKIPSPPLGRPTSQESDASEHVMFRPSPARAVMTSTAQETSASRPATARTGGLSPPPLPVPHRSPLRAAPSPDPVGRSHGSADGSRASRFTEGV